MDSSTAGTASFFPVRNSYTSDTYIALISFSQILEALPLLRKATEGFFLFFFFPPTQHHPQGQGSTGSPSRLTQALLLTFLLW